MEFILNSNFLSSVAIITTIVTVVFAIFITVYRNNKEKSYNEKYRRAELAKFRESMESRIYQLTDRLITSENRWKDVNHLVVDAANNIESSSISMIKPNNFLKALGVTKPISIDEEMVFVLTPFHDRHYDDFYTIEKVCSEYGLRVSRGDEEFVEGDMLKHILEKMLKAKIIVANINGRNPNVFYEMGIAHALDKPVIVISKYGNEIPFDLRSKQMVLYKNRMELSDLLRKALIRVSIKKNA